MELLTLGIVSAVVTAVVGGIKKHAGTSGWQSVASLVVVSLVAGLGYWLIKETNLWRSALEVLVVSNAIYGVIVKQLLK